MQTSQIGGQPCSDTSPYEVNENCLAKLIENISDVKRMKSTS